MIALLGMHRSGTSALSRTLGELGVWQGSEQYVTRRSEHALVQECNQRLLEAQGGHWSAPPELDDGWERRPELAPIDSDARAAVADLATAPISAWKDPRTCLTLPYWRARMPADPVVVVSYRHPLEVAGSLRARNDFGPGHVVALWERYNHSLLAAAAGLPTIVVAYADLVADPGGTLRSLCDGLAEFGVALDPARVDAAADVVDTGRRHHVHDDVPDESTTPQQRTLWHALRTLPPRSAAFVPPELPLPHPASRELLAQRAATIRVERELADARAQLRSRRALARNFVDRLRAGRSDRTS